MNDADPDLFSPRPGPKLAEPAALESSPVGRLRAGRTHREEALEWIVEHPETIRLLLELARAPARKKQRFSIGLLFEVVRYKYIVGELTGTPKLNNNHRAYVARHLISLDPTLEEFIGFREVRS